MRMNTLRNETWYYPDSVYYYNNGWAYYFGSYGDLGVYEIHFVDPESTAARNKDPARVAAIVDKVWAEILKDRLPITAETVIFSDAYFGERSDMGGYYGDEPGYFNGRDPRMLGTWQMYHMAEEDLKKFMFKAPNRVNPNSGHVISAFIFDVMGYRKYIGQI